MVLVLAQLAQGPISATFAQAAMHRRMSEYFDGESLTSLAAFANDRL
jgi:hypothetical protein